MAKRLQVILQDPDYREIQRMARSRRMSLAEWVRQALDVARRSEPVGLIKQKTRGYPGGRAAPIPCRRHPADAF